MQTTLSTVGIFSTRIACNLTMNFHSITLPLDFLNFCPNVQQKHDVDTFVSFLVDAANLYYNKMVDWSIDFNCISTRRKLFYT